MKFESLGKIPRAVTPDVEVSAPQAECSRILAEVSDLRQAEREIIESVTDEKLKIRLKERQSQA